MPPEKKCEAGTLLHLPHTWLEKVGGATFETTWTTPLQKYRTSRE